MEWCAANDNIIALLLRKTLSKAEANTEMPVLSTPAPAQPTQAAP